MFANTTNGAWKFAYPADAYEESGEIWGIRRSSKRFHQHPSRLLIRRMYSHGTHVNKKLSFFKEICLHGGENRSWELGRKALQLLGVTQWVVISWMGVMKKITRYESKNTVESRGREGRSLKEKPQTWGFTLAHSDTKTLHDQEQLFPKTLLLACGLLLPQNNDQIRPITFVNQLITWPMAILTAL